jgi:hypothetical protein
MNWGYAELKYSRSPQRVTTHSLTDSFLSNGAVPFVRIGQSLDSPLVTNTDDNFKIKFNITLPSADK